MSGRKSQSTLASFFSPKPTGSAPGPTRNVGPPLVPKPLEGGGIEVTTRKDTTASPLRTPLRPMSSVSNSPSINSTKKRKADDDEEEITPSLKKKKLKRVRLDSDDSDYEEVSQDSAIGTLSTPDVADKLSQFESPVNSRLQNTPKSSHTLSTPSAAMSPATPRTASSVKVSADVESGDRFKHLSFKHLKPDRIKDKKGRRPDHPDYDPTTLFVPPDFLDSQTPGHQQWWLFKADNYDSILFFKVGKFYELYHMDAVTAVSELGITYMRGDYAHCGFPEIGYLKFADLLVQKGYKVVRVEQTETPDEMQARVQAMNRAGKKPKKYDRVVAREVCQVTTKATQLASSIESGCFTVSNNFLLSLVEKDEGFGRSVYGACFVDTKVGVFYLSQFEDDRFSSALRVFFSHTSPVELVFIKGQLSSRTQLVVKSMLPSVRKNALRSETEFYSSSKTLRKLQEAAYFPDGEWPDLLKQLTTGDSGFSDEPIPEYEMAINALGGCLFLLKQNLIDHDVISMGLFEKYSPLMKFSNTESEFGVDDKMILDSSTVANLGIFDIFEKKSCTLLTALDTCVTPFGKRLLKQMVCSPPCHPQAINQRLDAVAWLVENRDFVSKIKSTLKKTPDLEHLLSRIHSLGVNRKKIEHPDSRANMFEAFTYRKRNVVDFVTCLKGLKKCVACCEIFAKTECESQLLREVMGSKSAGGSFPDIADFVIQYDSSFDHDEACESGEIKPKAGLVQSYDNALAELDRVKRDSEQFIREQCCIMKDNRLQWSTSKMSHFQLEVPSDVVSRMPDGFQYVSKRKGWERFQSVATNDLLKRWTNAEQQREVSLKDVARQIFSTFDQGHSKCKKAVDAIAFLDVMMALAEFSRTADPVMCRPRIVESPSPFISMKNGKHPCLEQVLSGGYIPNDIHLGDEDKDDEESTSLVIVTGPNMGGKSTLMRQTGLLIVLAQLGCFVPAEDLTFSPVDRIFTRLGASDRILCGESTFFIEMSETCAILNYASKHSLVLVDELGRGTSTYDGTAIASAVVARLADRVRCRTLFSTHYHLLVEDFRENPRVGLGHMACIESEDEDNPGSQRITFLYKFQTGTCPKSYGFNAARMAGLPNQLIRCAQTEAAALEKVFNQRQRIIALANRLRGVIV